MSFDVTRKKRSFGEMEGRELKVPTKLSLKFDFSKFSAIILESDFQGRIQLKTAAALEGSSQLSFRSEILGSKTKLFRKRKENVPSSMKPNEVKAISIVFFHQGKEKTLVLQNARFFS